MILAGVVIAIFVVLAIIVIGLIMYFVGIYNSLVTLKNDIDRSFANIDVTAQATARRTAQAR